MSTQPPIRIEAKVNMAEFNDALKKIIEGSKRDMALVVNSRALHVAAKAHKLTPIASREAILKTYGAVKVAKLKKSGKNKGKVSFTTEYRPRTNAYYIVLNRMKQRGEWPPSSEQEIETKVRRFVSGKLSAVGSLRAGWRGIVGPLRYAVKLGLTNMRATRKGKFLQSVAKAFALGKEGDKSESAKIKHEAGTVKVATVGARAVCEGNYKVSVGRNKVRKIDGRVTNALNSAFASELAEMRQHLEERIKAQWEASQKRLQGVAR